ncbi:hypothetical protein HDU98_010498 [Podochytrium sp. JEL0797]|nr:hypothetical protein HDU98_010498 [Podochytrium sp. JEL0797]
MKYILPMCPYPSGSLHMGHLRVYTIADVLARFHRMQSPKANVIFPIAFDSFGLPAENAAIDRHSHPRAWSLTNIDSMRSQLKAMDTSFDWDRELSTCDPKYYKWTQFLFLKLYQHGLVYRKDSVVNWDPVYRTVLANEQVDAEGRADRSGALVEKRKLEQWFFKITEYQELQANWIGKEEGYQVSCAISGTNQKLDVFFTNPALASNKAEFVAIAYDHPLIQEPSLIPDTHLQRIRNLTREIQHTHLSPHQKNLLGGFTGLTCVHPFTSQILPVYVSGSVSGEFATGATLGSAKLDPKDAEFVALHVIPSLPSCPEGNTEEKDADSSVDLEPYRKTYFRLRDWLVSRQRYWGAPIPIIHCPSCGVVPVPESDLPITLPESAEFSGKGASPICDPTLTKTLLPVSTYIGGIEHAILHLLYARFMGHFLHKSNLAPGPWAGEPFHTLLAQGMVSSKTFKCPTTQRYLPRSELDTTQTPPLMKGTQTPAVVSWEKMSKSKYNGVDPSDLIALHGSDCVRVFVLSKAAPGDDIVWEGEGGVVGMQRWVRRCERVVEGVVAGRGGEGGEEMREIERVEREVLFVLNTTIREVTTALQHTHAFHVAISSLIKLTNHLSTVSPAILATSPVMHHATLSLVKLMSPFAPRVAKQLFAKLTDTPGEGVHSCTWPEVEERALQVERRMCVVMIDGKTRGVFEMEAREMKDEEVVCLAVESEVGKRWLVDHETRFVKVLVLKEGGVVNFLTRGGKKGKKSK